MMTLSTSPETGRDGADDGVVPPVRACARGQCVAGCLTASRWAIYGRFELIDSAGLGMLLLARDEAKKDNRQLILKGPCGREKRMFGVTKFNTLFSIEE
jgi:ABC-type transporter Mla MlaB component